MADFDMTFDTDNTFDMSFDSDSDFNAGMDNVQIVETGDYNKLANRPLINSVLVEGDKISDDYGLQNKMKRITEQMIDELLFGRS